MENIAADFMIQEKFSTVSGKKNRAATLRLLPDPCGYQ